MTAWREQSFWSKVGVLAALAFLMLIPGYSDAVGPKDLPQSADLPMTPACSAPYL